MFYLGKLLVGKLMNLGVGTILAQPNRFSEKAAGLQHYTDYSSVVGDNYDAVSVRHYGLLSIVGKVSNDKFTDTVA